MINRRNFIKLGSASAIALKSLGAKALSLNLESKQSVVYELNPVSSDSFLKLFDKLGGISTFVKGDIKSSLILIKPNFSLPKASSTGTVTSLASLEELCKALISLGAGKIVIADHTLMRTSDFANLEHFSLQKTYPQVKVILVNEERMFEPLKVPGKVLSETSIMKLLPKADFFINFANAKHHTATNVSLSIKNLMGAIWNRTDFHTKMDLHQSIADLALAVKPHLNLIDTRHVLLNGGPTGPGPLKNDESVFASLDMLALDSLIVSKYNFGGKNLSANDIKHLKLCFEAGVGEIDIDKIKVEKII